MRSSSPAALGVGLLAIVVSLIVMLRGNGACAVTPLRPLAASVAQAGRAGQATSYGPASPGGACGFPQPPADRLTVAVGPAEFDAAAACGTYLDVTGRLGTVRVKVDNLCPGCGAGQLDLSREAFARLDDVAKGATAISYRPVVDPALTGGLSFRVKEGSSRWWLAVQVDDHGDRLTSVEVSPGSGGWQRLVRQDWNYWVADRGAGPGPFRVRVRDDRGHSAIASGIRIAPGAVRRTAVRLYPGPAPSPGAAPTGATVGAAATTVSPSRPVPTQDDPASSVTPSTSRPASPDGRHACG